MRQMEDGIKQSFASMDKNIHEAYRLTREQLATTKFYA
ncbi:hypothetical protein C4K05_3612 [Pseudomonas chlororaphis subsp. aureofaciens]|nr:hypothetical protein C4K05_3612 [Pseudomonas chlororaphis subsp. aureofaciens]